MNIAPIDVLKDSTYEGRALESKMLVRGHFPYSKLPESTLRKKGTP